MSGECWRGGTVVIIAIRHSNAPTTQSQRYYEATLREGEREHATRRPTPHQWRARALAPIDDMKTRVNDTVMSMMPNKRLAAAGRMIIGVSAYGLRGCMLSIFRGKIHQNRHPKSGSLMMPCQMVVGYAAPVHSWAKERVIGCVNSHLAAKGSQEAGFTQPRAHSFAQHCSAMPGIASRLPPRRGLFSVQTLRQNETSTEAWRLHKCTSRQQRIHSIDCVAVQWLLKRSRN